MKPVIYILTKRVSSALYYTHLHGFDRRRCVAITHPAQLHGVPASQIIVLGPFTQHCLFDGIPLNGYISKRHSVAYHFDWGITDPVCC